jgi:K+-sensing histidine kinase KdpD
MENTLVKTEYASAERAEKKNIFNQSLHIKNLPMIKSLVDLVPDAFLVLNEQRQIVFCNNSFLHILGDISEKEVYGDRPGEALHCIHAGKNSAGCGTTKFCAYCGAVNTILQSQNEPNCLKNNECNILAEENTALNFKVWAKTIELDGEKFIFFIARDVSDQKRRILLEKIFFHDIMNTAGGLSGLVELLESADQDEKKELVELVKNVSKTLIDEIEAQKMIVSACAGELKTKIQKVQIKNMLEELVDIYSNHVVSSEKYIKIQPDTKNYQISTDPVILKRIIGNMLKNALEAVKDGETVVLGAENIDNTLKLWVQNPGVMPESAQMQVFQRSFSTKGTGRGLGTYSIKLLGETFLNGQVSFSSTESDGTIFQIVLPID